MEKKEMTEKEKNKIMHISYKLYLNTLKKAFIDMDLKSKGATFKQEDTGDSMVIKITIPKNPEDKRTDEIKGKLRAANE